MSFLRTLDLDYGQAEKELAELRKFLNDNPIFKESKIVKELKKRLHASCLIGSLIAGAPKPDLYKFEFPLLGTFRADLVVGSSHSRRFVLVEFEGAGVTSLFGPGGTALMRDWSKELEHGFGQLVDWAWQVNDAPGLTTLQSAFGCNIAGAVSLLVCGRDAHMDIAERKRFDYRATKVAIQGMITTVLTYDGLLVFLQDQIEAIKSYIHYGRTLLTEVEVSESLTIAVRFNPA